MNYNSLVTSEMKLRYLHRRMDELAQTEQKIKSHDFDFFRNMGHQIKGNAVTFEFPTLTAMGVSLEDSAVEKNSGEVARLAAELKLAVQGLLDRFENDKP